MIIVTGQPQHARASRGRIIKMEFSNLNAAFHTVGTKNEHLYRPRPHRRFGCIRFLIVFPEFDVFMTAPVRRFHDVGRAGGH
jgi:hypothetical protein